MNDNVCVPSESVFMQIGGGHCGLPLAAPALNHPTPAGSTETWPIKHPSDCKDQDPGIKENRYLLNLLKSSLGLTVASGSF